MSDNPDDQDQRERGDTRATPADDRGALGASEQAENAEITLDRDLEGAEPEQEAAAHTERIHRHAEQTDTPAHPESPARPDAPPRS